jgi:hypothetical protein
VLRKKLIIAGILKTSFFWPERVKTENLFHAQVDQVPQKKVTAKDKGAKEERREG